MKQKHRGCTLIESLVILVIIAVLYLVLRPVFTRPVMFTRLPIAPLNFHGTPLQTVVARLDSELLKHQRGTLHRVRWESATLKNRQVTLQTQSALPLGSVFKLLEANAQIHFDTGGLCGTCGGPIAPIMVRDLRIKAARKSSISVTKS